MTPEQLVDRVLTGLWLMSFFWWIALCYIGVRVKR
jgi:hypothetical protein